MKALFTFLLLGCAIVLLAVIAIGLMISINSGRMSWLLMGIFAFDSLLLLLLAGRALLCRHNGPSAHGL